MLERTTIWLDKQTKKEITSHLKQNKKDKILYPKTFTDVIKLSVAEYLKKVKQA